MLPKKTKYGGFLNMAYLFQSGTLDAPGVTYSLKSDATAIATKGAINFGATEDASVYYNDTDGLVLDTKTGEKVGLHINGTEGAFYDANGFAISTGDAFYIDVASVLNATTLGTAVVNSSLTSVGTLTSLAASGVISSSAALSGSKLGLKSGGTIGPRPVEDLLTFSAAGDLTFKDGAYDFDIASHDGTNGLLLGGTTVTATAAELNYNDIATLGTAAASKTLTIKGDSTWTVASMTCADLGAVTTIDINGGTVDGTTIGASTKAAISATTLLTNSTVEFGGITADTAVDVANDGLYFRDNDDSNGMKNVEIASFLTDIAGAGLAVSANQLAVDAAAVNDPIGNENATLSIGMNWASASLSTDRTWTLPACSTLDVGDVLRVKAPALGGYSLTVSPNAADRIDDLAVDVDVVLNSDNASISLIVVSGSSHTSALFGGVNWRIF
jgi:hypothetical protein